MHRILHLPALNSGENVVIEVANVEGRHIDEFAELCYQCMGERILSNTVCYAVKWTCSY